MWCIICVVLMEAICEFLPGTIPSAIIAVVLLGVDDVCNLSIIAALGGQCRFSVGMGKSVYGNGCWTVGMVEKATKIRYLNFALSEVCVIVVCAIIHRSFQTD